MSLGSQQDRNFLVAGEDGEVVGVLKIANAAFTATELRAQDAAAEHVAATEPQLRVAVPAANTDGETLTAVTDLGGGTAYARLLRFLPGGTVEDTGQELDKGRHRTNGYHHPERYLNDEDDDAP